MGRSAGTIFFAALSVTLRGHFDRRSGKAEPQAKTNTSRVSSVGTPPRRSALAPHGKGWAPDLCSETIGPKVAAADAIGIADWLERVDRGEWFTAADPELQALQVLAITHGASTRQVLGVSQGERAMTTLRNLLALAGYRLEAKRNLEEGDRAWLYRVVAEPLCRTGPTCPIKGIQLTFTR